MTVVEGMEEMSTSDDGISANQQVGMIFCYDGEKWCAITGKKAENMDSWYTVRRKKAKKRDKDSGPKPDGQRTCACK